MRRSSIRNRFGRNASPSMGNSKTAGSTNTATGVSNTQSANSQPSGVSSPVHGSTRRESLIKPTWQHITPGQIPPRTLDKINGIASDDSDDDDYHRRPSVIVHQHHNNNNIDSTLGIITGSGSSSNSFVRKDSTPQLRRASSMVVRNDGPSTSKGINGSAVAAAATDATAAVNAAGVSGLDICRNAGRAFIRMISSKSSTDEDEDYDVLGKVIMLGDSGVGKTCLLIRFRDGKYMPNHFITTVGIDFRNKVVIVDGTRVKLQIWDTAGQERFRSVTHAYYRDAHALLLLYDVTNKTTYDNIRAWLGEIREYAQEDVVIVLIGNKADCGNSERQVKREDGERLAREHNVPFMETSAKTGLNVELAFAAVARQLKSRGNENGDDGKFNVHDFVRDNTRAKTICAQCKSM